MTRGGSHSARSAWIEILCSRIFLALSAGRTPQGVRGLKSPSFCALTGTSLSHSARSAWIEIKSFAAGTNYLERSHSARSAWIEMYLQFFKLVGDVSHSARSAWIEIFCKLIGHYFYFGRTPQEVRGLKWYP